MADIFTGTNITIELDTGQDMTSATNLAIFYQKPDGTTGSWSGSADTNKITYTTADSDLDDDGIWKFQASATVGGNDVKGKIVDQIILQDIG